MLNSAEKGEPSLNFTALWLKIFLFRVFSFFGILFIPLIFEKRDFSAHLGILPSVFLSHENLGDKRDENKGNILKSELKMFR